MNTNFLNPDIKKHNTYWNLDKRTENSIQNHFRLSNYQILVLTWLKGIWTGILISLILHYFISH